MPVEQTDGQTHTQTNRIAEICQIIDRYIDLQNLQSLANISLGTDFRAKTIEVKIISKKFYIKNIVYISLMHCIILALEV